MVAPGHAARRHLANRARPSSLTAAARQGPWLILAPHPDDEALGAGGLIAGLSAVGGEVHVAFLTNGAGSHVGAPGWSGTRVAAVRAQEARAALTCLGVRKPLLLGWPDAAPPSDIARDVRRLATWCRRHRIRTIATTWEGEPHCDHEAAARLAAAVAREADLKLRYYLVWGFTDPALVARTRRHRVTSIPTARWRGHAARALERHRTQLGGRIVGARHRFVLPRAMRRLVRQPLTLLLEPARAP